MSMVKKPGKGSEGPTEIPQDLESALKALEKTVEKLETPELPLEESIQLFEEGTKLSDVCYSRLKEAEKKVEILLKKIPQPQGPGDYEAKDFDAHD
jgi:exodeoxyribonuclease VII small subunit